MIYILILKNPETLSNDFGNRKRKHSLYRGSHAL
jgi:hypothetical protein